MVSLTVILSLLFIVFQVYKNIAGKGERWAIASQPFLHIFTSNKGATGRLSVAGKCEGSSDVSPSEHSRLTTKSHMTICFSSLSSGWNYSIEPATRHYNSIGYPHPVVFILKYRRHTELVSPQRFEHFDTFWTYGRPEIIPIARTQSHTIDNNTPQRLHLAAHREQQEPSSHPIFPAVFGCEVRCTFVFRTMNHKN